jgi:secondary thiamine-phosphate synthase enzyme
MMLDFRIPYPWYIRRSCLIEKNDEKTYCSLTFLVEACRKNASTAMIFIQKEIKLQPRSRGFHLVTAEIISQIPEMKNVQRGVLHVFIKHTSASLTLNENADPSVCEDFEKHFNKLAPEHAPYYEHDAEGSDDMPAHLKASILGSSLSIPVTDGRLNLGIWQGIYFCEHRNNGGARGCVLTLLGEEKDF